jgi:hypothetical protein
MIPNNRLLLLVTLAGAVLSLGQTQPQRTATPVLNVCDVLSTPLKYNGHVIVIRGRVDGTDEGAWLLGDHCSGISTTGDYTWRSIIYLAMPTIAAPLRVHQVNFSFDWESRRRAQLKYQKLRKSVPVACVEFTYSGLFETREDWPRHKLVYPNGVWKYAGFGHLGEAPGQLLLKSEDDVTVLPDCTANNGEGKR